MTHHAQYGESASQAVSSGSVSHPISPRASAQSRRRRTWGAAFLTLALGGAAWGLSPSLERYHRELTSTRSELAALQKDHVRSEGELRTLRDEKARLAEDLDGAQVSARELSVRLADLQNRLGEVEEKHTFVAGELAEFRQMAGQFESMIDAGNLDVSYHRGRMVVELPAQLLFPSGSADLTPEGEAALVQVARILRGVRGQRFLVAGHTDNLPVSGAQFESNWELSVTRALHVTQALIGAGVKPQQLMTAGRAQYEPVASNASERGRQKNRRIEIVLEPYLAEVATRLAGIGEVDVD